METFDPNIAPSKKIVDVANNYKKEILNQARPILEILQKREDGQDLTERELTDLEASNWLIRLAQEFENVPDLSIHIPSAFLMISGIIPSPLGFAYLGFESIIGQDL